MTAPILTARQRDAKHWSRKLVAMNACEDAVAWAAGQPSLAVAWKECKRGDWMLWLIGRKTKGKPWSDERKPLVACAIDCALLARQYMPKGSIDGLAVWRRWCDGKATWDEAGEARRSLYAAAAYAAYAAYACDAAKAKVLAKAAAIVRRHYPKPPSLEVTP